VPGAETPLPLVTRRIDRPRLTWAEPWDGVVRDEVRLHAFDRQPWRPRQQQLQALCIPLISPPFVLGCFSGEPVSFARRAALEQVRFGRKA